MSFLRLRWVGYDTRLCGQSFAAGHQRRQTCFFKSFKTVFGKFIASRHCLYRWSYTFKCLANFNKFKQRFADKINLVPKAVHVPPSV